MNYFEEINGSLVFRENGETVMVSPWGADSLRVRSCILGEITEGQGALLPPEMDQAEDNAPETGTLQEKMTRGKDTATRRNETVEEKDVSPRDAERKDNKEQRGDISDDEVRIRIGDGRAEIRNGKIRAELIVQEWGKALQITFRNQKGEILLQEIPNGGALQKKARQFKPLPGGAFSLKASFVSDPEEKLYGMGQYQQEIMNLKGCNLELAHRNSQASVPFYVSSLGYGFLWNNPAVGEVHFGLNTTQWEAMATRQLDYWITAGDTPAQVVEAYANATGKAPMMPEFGLGFWQCKLRYYNQGQVLDVAREYKRRGIPINVLVIDYYHWPRCGDWRFDEEYFPAPREMAEEIKKMGIELMVSVWPQVDWRSENYEEMKQQGLLVKSNTGIDVQMNFHGNNVFMDATNPRAREYVWEKCRKNYADLGIRMFWLDEAEPEFTTYDFENYRYYAGPVAEVGNIYPREYARAFYEGQQKNGQKEIVNLLRCAWAGSQRYGALVWSGDIMSTYEDFRKQICAGIHMGLSGIPWWTTDIGGFHAGVTEDPDFQELLVRWFQFGTFCPVMRLHGCRQPVEEIVNRAGEVREGTGVGNEIWSFGEKNYEILLKYIRIREKMRDYTRSLMREAHEKGTPVMRAMFYEFPDDPQCWEIKDAYLFGPDLLVAPVCHKGAKSRSVYLPEGTFWVSASDGTRYEGGRTIEAAAPIGTIPVFLRGGRQEYLKGEI